MQIENRLGVVFRDRSLLELALVHGSHLNESQDAQTQSNERLEFLGDAILGMVIAEALYHEWPEAGEGILTATRSALVRRETLAEVANNLGLGTYLQLGRGEAASGGRHKEKNLADALEAVVAAVYLDQGYPVARGFVLRHLGPKLEEARSRSATSNYKAMLQEYLQSIGEAVPRYRVINAIGPDHQKEFTAEALLHDTILGRGTGRSRKAAETAAARSALARLHTKEE
ncbi:MAG: ribonuclease III [Dehalococcoidia bacterium]|nr:ribonuclease III [Dehalococcoidia bacterium]